MVTSFGYAYRQLTCADVPLLKNLLRVFEEAFDEVDIYQRSVSSDDYLIRLLSKQHFIAVVAKKGEEVVGGLAAYELDKFEQDRREIYIYDLAVAQSHRRRGVATGLIGELKRIASKRNVYVIFVQAICGMAQLSRCMSRWARRKLHIILTSRYTQRFRKAEEQVARNKQRRW